MNKINDIAILKKVVYFLYKKIIKSLTNTFESHSYTIENGIEFWYARDLQHLPDYTE